MRERFKNKIKHNHNKKRKITLQLFSLIDKSWLTPKKWGLFYCFFIQTTLKSHYYPLYSQISFIHTKH